MVGTAFGLATVCAAYEAGLLAVDGPQVLVVVATTAVPQDATPLAEVEGVDVLLRRFDAVHDLNEALGPHHPRRWRPRTAELRAWEGWLRRHWDLGDGDVTLLTESVAGEPAHALARVFAGAPLEVYSDGLMSYGPSGALVPAQVGERVEQLLHLDLVPGLVPVLHREWDVRTTVVPTDALRTVVAQVAAAAPRDVHRPTTALVLGQYLASDGLLTADAEIDLYAEMVRRCTDLGHARVVFKQHPSAPAGQGEAVAAALGRQGLAVPGFVVARRAVLAETWFARGEVDLVVACFSTALLTAATAYGLPVARLGTGPLRERLTPTSDLNRVPVLLVDAVVPDLATDGPGPLQVPADLQGALDEVAADWAPLRRSGSAPGSGSEQRPGRPPARPRPDGRDLRRPDAAA